MNIFGGGWGGRPSEDGESASVSVCQGDVRNTPVELQEIKYPVLIDKHAFRGDSGGAGRFRGGLGLEVATACCRPARPTSIASARSIRPGACMAVGAGATNSRHRALRRRLRAGAC